MNKEEKAPEVDAELLRLTAQITSSHIANNPVEVEALPALILAVYRSLAAQIRPAQEPVSVRRPKPAVPIGKSVFTDYIVCLEDGMELKTLTRRLKRTYGMTPQQYRQKWGLPASYPMVAPNYSILRATLAKQRNFSRKSQEAAQTSLSE